MSDPELHTNPEPPPEPPAAGPSRTPLEEAVERLKLPVGLTVAAVALAPEFLAIPLVNRYEVWAAEAVFVALVFAAHRGVAWATIRKLAWTAAAILVVLIALDLPGESDDELKGNPPGPTPTPTATPTPEPTPEMTHIGDDSIATLRADGHRFVFYEDGTIDRFDGQAVTATYKVEGPIEAATSCAGALMVTHGRGKIARVHPGTGKIEVDYPYAHRSGDVVCGGDAVFASKPDEGTVVMLTGRRLRYVDAFNVVNEVTALTYGGQAIWLLDSRARELVGIRVATKEKLGPYPIGDGATDILYAGEYVWLLDRDASCLTRFDTARNVEVGPGVPTGRWPVRMRHVDGQLLVPDYADNSILKVDVDKVRATRHPITVGDHGRLIDADQHGDVLVGLDSRNNALVSLTPVQQLEAQHKRAYTRGRDCSA